MRNCVLRGLEACTDEDIIILTDLNEIPSPEAVRKGIKKLSKDGCGVLTFEMYQFFYYVNYFAYTRVYCQSKPKMLKYSEFGKEHRSSFVDTTCESFDVNTTPVAIRMLMDYSETLSNGGWRFDGVGSDGAVRRFFEALVENVDDDVIQRYISEGRVPRKEDIRLCSVNDDRWIPAYLLEHRGEYSYLFTDVRSCEEIPAWERCVKKIIRNVQRSSKLRKTKHAVGTLIRRVKVK
jgi:beta-1,4-mannosyl-glycoprotein beta-1,4-N-acetylglucosaminyltransferase